MCTYAWALHDFGVSHPGQFHKGALIEETGAAGCVISQAQEAIIFRSSPIQQNMSVSYFLKSL